MLFLALILVRVLVTLLVLVFVVGIGHSIGTMVLVLRSRYLICFMCVGLGIVVCNCAFNSLFFCCFRCCF